MRKKLTVSTMALAFKLLDIQHHLRDCTEDIMSFANAMARRVDFIGRPDTTPQDFVLEWNGVIEALDREIAVDYLYLGDDNPVAHRSVAKKMAVRSIGERLIQMFAEDLCGKEFAREVEKAGESDLSSISESERQYPSFKFSKLSGLPEFPRKSQDEVTVELVRKFAKEVDFVMIGQKSPGVMAEVEAIIRDAQEEGASVQLHVCHPFPPGDPVMVEEAKRQFLPHRFDHLMRPPAEEDYLGGVDRID